MQVAKSSQPRLKSTDSGARPTSPKTDDDMVQTVRDVGMFVTKALPVLIELARKGGRYSEDTIQHLRPSFLAAIDSGRIYWNKAVEPEHFEEYVKAKDELKSRHSEWTSDKVSGYCLLCLNKFGYFGRHHCRACGILCCQLCSSKRLTLRIPSKGHSDRVCDGCFNKLTAESEVRHLAVVKAQKIMEAAVPEKDLRALSPVGKEDRESESVSSNHTTSTTTTVDENTGIHKVRSSGSISSATTPTSVGFGKSISGDNLDSHPAASVQATIGEVGEALEQRGAKLQAVEEKSQALVEVDPGHC